MTCARLKNNFVSAYAALMVAVAVLIGTGLVSEWGVWYSPNLAYREQTEALFNGSLALHNTPAALRLDLAWYHGGVQQVWGLGVPIWRMPFEALAKVCGQPAFPDRLEFGAAVMLLAYLIFRTLPVADAGPGASVWNPVTISPSRFASAAVLLFFPPFVAICRFRFDVYEEASCYSYLYGVALFVGLISFRRNPAAWKFYLLAALAGFSPIVRPTLGVYGIATITLLIYEASKAGFKWRQSAVGMALYCTGGLLLVLTNKIRFGSGLEFGHSLNFNGFPVWMYDRIYNPYHSEPLLSAGRELLGAFFFDSRLNGLQSDLNNIFWGQSFTPRWRNLYLTCYDLSFLILFSAFLGCWLWDSAPRMNKALRLPADARLAGFWSLIGFMLLFAFYLRVPVLSNRYIFDTGPAIAVAIVGFIIGLEGLCRKWAASRAACFALINGTTVLWIALEVFYSRANALPLGPLNQGQVVMALAREYPPVTTAPVKYEAGIYTPDFNIPYNRMGWDPDGRMSTLVVLFVNDPDYLQIRVTSLSRERPIHPEKIEAKIGLEALAVDSIKGDEHQSVIRFKPPNNSLYRKGIQVVFLAYVDEANISYPLAPLQLQEAQWRD